MASASARPLRLDRRVLAGFALSSLGNGLTLPFLYVFLARVQELGPATAGWLFAWMGLAGVAATPLIGVLMDRHGPRAVMVGGLLVEVLAIGSLGFVEGLGATLLVLAGVVCGAAPLWPGTTALLAEMLPAEARERAYGLAFLGINAGLGLGGVAGAALVDVGELASFQRLYLLDAGSYLLYALVLLSLPRGTGRVTPGSRDEGVHAGSRGGTPAGGWREVLADRRIVALLGCGVLAVTFGYAQLEAGATAYAVEVAGIPARALGWAFGANTLVIVLAQLLALRLVARWRRTSALALAVGTWSLAWAVVGLSDLVEGPLAVLALVAGLAVFGLGETLWAPVASALVNALAPDRLRGRYNAALGVVWTLGQVFGPLVAGLLIGHGHGHLWAGVVVGGTLVAALLLLTLRRVLTPLEDGLAAPDVRASVAA